jgi:hypothetical protein
LAYSSLAARVIAASASGAGAVEAALSRYTIGPEDTLPLRA